MGTVGLFLFFRSSTCLTFRHRHEIRQQAKQGKVKAKRIRQIGYFDQAPYADIEQKIRHVEFLKEKSCWLITIDENSFHWQRKKLLTFTSWFKPTYLTMSGHKRSACRTSSPVQIQQRSRRRQEEKQKVRLNGCKQAAIRHPKKFGMSNFNIRSFGKRSPSRGGCREKARRYCGHP